MVPAKNFLTTLAANVDNKKLTDEQFREFVRNTLPIVDFPKPTSEQEQVMSSFIVPWARN
jgi:hypothetical protein